MGPASTDDFAAAVAGAGAGRLHQRPTPGDAIRALAQLVTTPTDGSASGADALILQAESGAPCSRRAAAAQLVLATANATCR